MLFARALGGITFMFLLLAGVLFGCEGRLSDVRAWGALAVFFGCAGAITVWLWGHDRALLERRIKAGPGAESDAGQNVVQGLAGLVFLAAFAVPGLERRWGHAAAPLAVSLLGDGLIASGFWVVFLTFRENTFTAGTIELAEGQTVIDSGPYARVRHPMYSGALVLVTGIPLALGSWWGLVPAALLVPLLLWRLKREEAFLAEHLAGYDAYLARTPWRLVPGLW